MATRSNRTGAHPAHPTSGDERPDTLGNDTAREDHLVRRDRVDDSAARDKFGGINIGAAFFGWLVAIAIAILLTSILGAILAAVGSSANITQSDAQRSAGTIGVAAGVVL